MSTTVADPYYQRGLVTIYHGDATKLVDDIVTDQTIIVTDPPYGINMKPYVNKGVRHHRPLEGDHNQALAAWVLQLSPMKIVFGAHAFWHLLPQGGRLWCWDKRTNDNADRMFGHNFELAWGNIPGKQHQMIRIMHGGVVNADGWGMKRVHPTQKPVAVMKKIISQCPQGFTIVDPFAGSGSTLLAALDEGRRAIGIELDQQYCDAMVQRLKAHHVD
jgi:site-specific DNA-methyltransferase (adenine-specific)